MNTDLKKNNFEISVLPLRDIVVFPYMVIPLFVGRDKSIKCIENSKKNNNKIFLVTQKEATTENPQSSDLFSVGTVASILQILKLPDGTEKVLIEGLYRAKVKKYIQKEKELLFASVHELQSPIKEKNVITVLKRTLLKKFKNFFELNKKTSFDLMVSIEKIDEADKLVDTIAANMPLKISDKQSILELSDIKNRLETLIKMIQSEINLLNIEKKIRSRIQNQIEKSQKEYYLNEQIKAIQKELGVSDELIDEKNRILEQLKEKKLSKEAKIRIKSELKKLSMMSSMSAEATVTRNYIDWLLQVPWQSKSKIKKNLKIAKIVLDKDHFGLIEVKERILEFLAVQNRKKKLKGPILCLIGPPGVGKTSLGQSIAKATGRKFIKMALGGVKDEAEIRGHRRTYVGSMPGRIIQKLVHVGVKNPLFLLDEIDKISCDVTLNPVSALLEVLDSEQNFSFTDHYIELDYDLSEIMFIATANTMNIPSPLLDRMEIIRISGYTEEEKINIAKNYLYAKQIKKNALKTHELFIHQEVFPTIIRHYTREAGVRNLERELSKICRKIIKKILVENIKDKIEINNKNVKKYLGEKRFDFGKKIKPNQIGQVTGLAWTEVGGEVLTIETSCVVGKGNLIYTGSLGKVMKESIQTALTVVRSQSKNLGIDCNFYEKKDIHVHVPEGAIPKDGPSAGIAMCTSIVSSLTSNPVKSSIAMTGEITLSGDILSIGGLKEKLLAARRSGIKKVILPVGNKKNLKEIEREIKSCLKIYTVKNIREVLSISLQNNPYLN